MSLAFTYTLYAVLILWGLYVSCSLDSHRARLRELEAKRKPPQRKCPAPDNTIIWHPTTTATSKTVYVRRKAKP